MGPPDEPVVEEKGKGIPLKVIRETALKMTIKWQHDLPCTDHFHHSLLPTLSALSLID